MALTDAQRAKVRMYLGYSDMGRMGHSDLEGAMSALSSDAVTLVVAVLTRLDALDDKLDTAEDRAGIVSVDNGGVVWASDGMSMPMSLVAAGRRHVQRLASILGVQIGADIFASTLSSGPCGLG